MAKNYTEINQEQRQFGSAYRKASPDTMNAFLALHKAAMRDGELSLKHKELIATAIAIQNNLWITKKYWKQSEEEETGGKSDEEK